VLRRLIPLLLTVAIGWGIALLQSRPTPLPSPTPVGAQPSAAVGRAPSARAGAGAPSTAGITRPEVGFRSRNRLMDHYAKHGGEFGRVRMPEYLAMAQSLRDRPAGGDILEIVRPADGVISRFDRSAGTFGAYDRDGTIRTFFRPNDGEAYFTRQARRRPQPSEGR
jgi:hypothetical protein